MILNPGEQATIREDVVFEGSGIHTGQQCRVVVHGAPAGSGIVFLTGGRRIKAWPANVVDTARGTSLGDGGEKVILVEHLMAALAGMGVDNAECEVSGPEPPALDGSALAFAEGLRTAGVVKQGRERRVVHVRGVECVAKGDAVMVAAPAETFEAVCLLRFDHRLIGMQAFSFSGDAEAFLSDVAGARTFGLAAWAEELRNRGLALGASEENTVVVFDDHLSPALRFPNEFARHKLLDILGDLALVGGAVAGSVYGIATGHWANVELARRLWKE